MNPSQARAVAGEVLPRLLREYERFPLLGRWAAHRKGTGDFAGWFALRVPEGGDSKRVELGYRLRREAWGQNMATEGVRALLRHAFTTARIDEVYAETMAVNLASRRVLEKAGLRLIRIFHLDWDDPIDGAEHGEVEYAMTRDEWQRLTG